MEIKLRCYFELCVHNSECICECPGIEGLYIDRDGFCSELKDAKE